MNTNSIFSQQINSGVASTARTKRIQKDRHRRPAEHMRQNGEKPSDSDPHQNPESKPHFFSGDMHEDIYLRNEIEGIIEKILSCSQKNQRDDAKEQGMQVDVVI